MSHYSLVKIFFICFSAMLISACDIFTGPESYYHTDTTGLRSLMATAYASIQREGTVPPHAARIYAYTAIAYYEGLRLGYPSTRSLAGQLNGLLALPTPSKKHLEWDQVGINAASYVLSELLKQNKALHHDTVQGISALLSTNAGTSEVQYGALLGKEILEYANTDGFLTTRGKQWSAPVSAQAWVPTAPAFAPALEPYWGSLRPFVMKPDYSECVPKAIPSYSEDPESEMYKQAKTVYDISKSLTEDQRSIAIFWADSPAETGTPPGHWIMIGRQMIEEKKLSLLEAADLFVRMSIGLNDAFMAGWYCKYRFNLLRPITAIQRFIDPSWTPLLITPNFPEYVSGHSVGSGASSSVLTSLLGTTSFIDRTHLSRGLGSRSFRSFLDAANEAANSRLYAGIHYPMGNHEGLLVGQCVGSLVSVRIQTH